MLLTTDLIHRLIEMLGDMEPIMHDLRLRSVAGGAGFVSGPHVHGHGFNGLSPLLAQAFPQGVGGRFVPAVGYVQHPRPVDVGHDGDVVLAPPEALLVQAHMPDVFQFALDQAPFDPPVQDRLQAGPGQPQQPPRRFHAAGRLQHADGEGFEQQGEPPVRFRPGNRAGLHAALGAVRPRRASDNPRFKLHGVQMPPRPFGTMVVQRAGPTATAAAHRLTAGFQPDLHPLVLQRQVDVRHLPSRFQTQQQTVVLGESFHAERLRKSPTEDLPATKTREEPPGATDWSFDQFRAVLNLRRPAVCGKSAARMNSARCFSVFRRPIDIAARSLGLASRPPRTLSATVGAA